MKGSRGKYPPSANARPKSPPPPSPTSVPYTSQSCQQQHTHNSFFPHTNPGEGGKILLRRRLPGNSRITCQISDTGFTLIKWSCPSCCSLLTDRRLRPTLLYAKSFPPIHPRKSGMGKEVVYLHAATAAAGLCISICQIHFRDKRRGKSFFP